MNILRKFVWLLLTLGLLVLTVQTASPIALGLAICMVVLPLLCLPLQSCLAAKKLKLSANMPVNLKKGTEGIIGSNCPKSVLLSDLPVRLPHPLGESAERGSPVYDPLLRRLAEENTDRPRHLRQPVLRTQSA